jgi:hypothetical protein
VGAAVIATCLALSLRAWHLERAVRDAGGSESAHARAPRLGAPTRHEVGA